MAFGIGDELSVRVSADTGDFERGMDRSQRTLSEFKREAARATPITRVLANNVDNLSNQFGQLGREAGGASRDISKVTASAAVATPVMGSLSQATSVLGLSLTSIQTAPLTALVPIATSLSTTLIPLAAVVGSLTAGVTALAGAFGAIVGTGILAFGRERAKQAQTELQNLKSRKQELQGLVSGRETQIQLQQSRLETFQAELRNLREIKNSEQELTEQQKARMETLRSEISSTKEAINSQRRKLEAEQAEIQQKEQSIKKTEEQASITGALGAAFADLRDELIPIIANFGDKFVPLIESALDAIPGLVESIFDAVGNLQRFEAVLRDLGGAAQRVLPAITRELFNLAVRVLPQFVDLVAWIGRNAGTIFDDMLATTREIGPTLLGFAEALIQATPELNRLGKAILKTVVPAMSDFIGFAEDIINFAGESDGFVNFIRSGVAKLINWINGPGRTMIGTAATAFIDTLTALMGGGEDDNLFTALTDLIGNTLVRLSDWFDAGGQEKVTQLLVGLFDALEMSITDTEGKVKDKFFDPITSILGSIFDSITKALQSDAAAGLSASLASLSEEILETFVDGAITFVLSDEFRKDIARLATAAVNVIVPALKEGIKVAIAGIAPGALLASEILDRANLEGPALGAEETPARGRNIRGRNVGTSSQEVQVVVDVIDDKFEAFVREGSRQEAERTIQQIERRQQRLGDRGSSP